MDIKEIDVPRRSWLRHGIELRSSPLHGLGVYTTVAISQGERVIVWGGMIVTYDEFFAGRGLPHSNVGISETHCLVALNDEGLSVDDYMNHSCDPNLWLEGPITLVARRDIAADEELTIDYAIEVGHSSYVMKSKCSCGTKECRGTITGADWRLSSLQEKYRNHFSPFISERIQKLRSAV